MIIVTEFVKLTSLSLTKRYKYHNLVSIENKADSSVSCLFGAPSLCHAKSYFLRSLRKMFVALKI